MLFLLQNGYTDVAAMVFYQTVVKDVVVGAVNFAFAPKRLTYDQDVGDFVYLSEMSDVL